MDPGSKAPGFSALAAVSGRVVSPETLAGKRAVLVFHGVKTQDAPKEVGKAVRVKWPDAGQVVVANIVDLRSMAGVWRRVAEAQIKATYEKMAGKVTAGDPADYVLICPDWENQVAPLFGVPDPNAQAGIAVLDPSGKVLGVRTGSGLGEQALSLLG